MLKVILMEVRGMPIKTSDLSCTLSLNSYKLLSKRDSKTSRRGGPGSAVWRQYFEFPVVTKDDHEPVFKIKIMDHDPMGVPFFIGTASFKIDDLEDGFRRDLSLPIEIPRTAGVPVPKKKNVDLIDKVGESLHLIPKLPENGIVRVRVVFKRFVKENFV